MRCQVRSFPPLSSGSSRSDFSHRMRMGERLNPFLIDEGAMPEFEVEETPQTVTAFRAAGGVVAQETIDGWWIDESALARTAIEEDIANDAVPAGARPAGKWHRETHFRP